MNVITTLAITIWCSSAVFVPTEAHPGVNHREHHENEDKELHHHPHKATSYQSIELEHFHAVPTYVKKEDAHLLKHPVQKGKTSADVKVHHGHKHDPGHAISNIQSSVHQKANDHIPHEPVEYKHQAHVDTDDSESPRHHYHAKQHYRPSEEAGAEYSQAHAAIALVDHGGQEEYKTSYGQHYHGYQEQGQARAASDGNEEQANAKEKQQNEYYYQPVQVQFEGRQSEGGNQKEAAAAQEEEAPKEYQYYTIQQPSQKQQGEGVKHYQ